MSNQFTSNVLGIDPRISVSILVAKVMNDKDTLDKKIQVPGIIAGMRIDRGAMRGKGRSPGARRWR